MRYLVARNAQHAVSTALTDCGWEQIGPTTFKDGDGEKVTILTDPRQLQGHRKATVYMGYGCVDRNDWREFQQLESVGVICFRDAPLKPAVTKFLEETGRSYLL